MISKYFLLIISQVIINKISSWMKGQLTSKLLLASAWRYTRIVWFICAVEFPFETVGTWKPFFTIWNVWRNVNVCYHQKRSSEVWEKVLLIFFHMVVAKFEKKIWLFLLPYDWAWRMKHWRLCVFPRAPEPADCAAVLGFFHKIRPCTADVWRCLLSRTR